MALRVVPYPTELKPGMALRVPVGQMALSRSAEKELSCSKMSHNDLTFNSTILSEGQVSQMAYAGAFRVGTEMLCKSSKTAQKVPRDQFLRPC